MSSLTGPGLLCYVQLISPGGLLLSERKQRSCVSGGEARWTGLGEREEERLWLGYIV